MNGRYAVLGSTGAQGGAVVAALTEAGASVRGITRHRQSSRAQRLAQSGVEVVAADLSDIDAVGRAFDGVDAVFALTTPFEDGPSAELDQGATIIAAARLAQVPHLVFSSVSDADRHTGIPHFDSKARVEEALRASGVPYTIVGPTYFYDNLLGDIEQLRAGRIVMPIPADIPLQQLSRRDLGRFVAVILGDPLPFRGVRIDIASDDPTPRQMASVLSGVLDRTVDVTTVDPHQISSPDMRAMFEFLSGTGYSADISRLKSLYPDVGWQTFEDWAHDALG
ncbi:NmrA/HSCARG family protein [Nocardia sp. 2YAB30]|uniref:NmrA/HSCARG family protein n=1 Tax=unclassified Nocardia TaxID=2637762 RepID=UPI003F96AA2E